MKTYQACIPCYLNLIGAALARADLDESSRQELLDKVQKECLQIDLDLPPSRNAGAIYQRVLQETNQDDIFRAYKRASIQEALKLYPRLKKLVAEAEDPLDAAIRVCALGNILDIANTGSYDLDQEINRLMAVKIWGDSLDLFRTRLAGSASLLILADNAGESVFDRVLIETLSLPVTYAVKSGPAFDDALVEDAHQAGIHQAARLIASGTPYPGTYLPSCSPEFQALFRSSPLVLAKGQANFETLSDTSREIFFLLKVKCEVVSQEISHPLGSLILQHYPKTS